MDIALRIFALAAATVAAWADGAFGSEETIYLAHPAIVDGITMRDDSGNRYRLDGITHPAAHHACVEAEKLVECRDMARAELGRYTASVLTCKRTLRQENAVRCRDFMGRDVAARMVASGWAEPDRASTQDYIFEAMEAKARRLGIWQILKTAKR